MTLQLYFSDYQQPLVTVTKFPVLSLQFLFRAVMLDLYNVMLDVMLGGNVCVEMSSLNWVAKLKYHSNEFLNKRIICQSICQLIFTLSR